MIMNKVFCESYLILEKQKKTNSFEVFRITVKEKHSGCFVFS